MSKNIRHLTGITTSGTPHIGNYVGAIRPAIAASRDAGSESFYFLADYHALIKAQDPARIQRSTLEIAATWLACGLDPERVTFYRQSDIVEVPELTWLLTCVTGKGLLNRAHAYKAAVDVNIGVGDDADAGINAGLYMYPVLMAADILMFRAHKVPVGRDQVQHIEIARDIAARFNHVYGGSFRAITGRDEEPLVLPDAVIDDNVATLPGLDGRKMSKSYDNVIPLFASARELKKLIAGIVTDSRAPGEAKDTEGSNVFQLYQAFATADEAAAMRQAFADGIGWGDAKQKLFERIDAELAEARDRYNELMARPADIEDALRAGAAKARRLSAPLIAELRQSVGLRDLRQAPSETGKAKTAKATQPTFKQYRDSDGRFYFKLADADGKLLLQSRGFESPRDAGQMIARIKQDGAVALQKIEDGAVKLGEDVIGDLATEALGVDELIAALAAFAEEA